MIAVNDHATIGETFFRAADAYADKSFLAVPANPARAYDPAGKEITYAEAARTVRELMQAYSTAGYGVGHRIALLIENRPEHMLHKLAMNALGVCCVPLNPDHRPREMAYVLDHAKVDLVVVLTALQAQLRLGMQQAEHAKPQVVLFENFTADLPTADRKATSSTPDGSTAASVLYTSGTTGRPKGCVLCSGATARYKPTAFSHPAGGPRFMNPEPPLCITSAWSCRCCWVRRLTRMNVTTPCALR